MEDTCASRMALHGYNCEQLVSSQKSSICATTLQYSSSVRDKNKAYTYSLTLAANTGCSFTVGGTGSYVKITYADPGVGFLTAYTPSTYRNS